MHIPMSSPDITEAEIAAVHGVMQTSMLSIGPQITAFEEAFAAYVGTRYAVGVNSGTSGLHLAMIAANVRENDLVLTSPFSFIASANCILYERGIPLFVDIDPATGNMDAALTAEALDDLYHQRPGARRWLPPALRNSGYQPTPAQLKALLPIHAFGQPADMGPLNDLARQYNLALIEDACESIGSDYNGQRSGTLGDAAVFAFYPNKQMTTGEGGMITTDNEAWYDLFRSLRNQGRDVFNAWLNHTRLGYNYRLDELSAALGLVQIRRMDDMVARRAQVAAWYHERLAGHELLELPQVVPATTRMSWFVYVVRTRAPLQRNELMRALGEAGIPSRPYFTPIHTQGFYRERFGYQHGDFPVTDRLGDCSLALPFSSVMTETQVSYVCEQIEHAIRALV